MLNDKWQYRTVQGVSNTSYIVFEAQVEQFEFRVVQASGPDEEPIDQWYGELNALSKIRKDGIVTLSGDPMYYTELFDTPDAAAAQVVNYFQNMVDSARVTAQELLK